MWRKEHKALLSHGVETFNKRDESAGVMNNLTKHVNNFKKSLFIWRVYFSSTINKDKTRTKLSSTRNPACVLWIYT